MNTPPPPEQEPTSQLPPEPENAKPVKLRWLPHGCWGYFLAVALVGILAGLALPLFSRTATIGTQTRALAYAKSVGLALKLFAGDHDGNYPTRGVPVEMKDTPENSNQALACLLPTYTQSESIFGNKASAYQSAKGPDNVIDRHYTGKPVETLRPGENTFGYMAGLTEAANPGTPVVVDGSDGTGHYRRAEHVRGGTWKIPRAVVIRLDNSGSIENLRGPDDALYIPRADDPSKNALETEYLGKDVHYLDPAVMSAATSKP